MTPLCLRPPPRSPHGCLRILLLFALASFVALEVFAQTNTSKHLLLIDTGYSAARRRSETSALVARTVESAFGGAIAEGEKYSVWLYDVEPKTRAFPDQIWSANDAPLQAQLIARFLSAHKYTGKSNLRAALGESLKFLKRDGDVRVFVIADHTTTSIGEPLPELSQFEEFYRAHLREVKHPAVATINAQDANILLWSIDHNTGEFQAPKLPDRNVVTAANHPGVLPPREPTPELLAPPVLKITDQIGSTLRVASPLVKTNEVVPPVDVAKPSEKAVETAAQATPPVQKEIPAPTPPAQQKVEETVRAPVTKVEEPAIKAPVTPEPIREPTTAKAEEQTPSKPADPLPEKVEATPSPVIKVEETKAAEVATSELAPTAVPAPTPQAPPPLALAPIEQQPASASRRWLAVTAGVVVFFALLIILRRRKRVAPSRSLISQSIHTKDH